MLETNPNYPIVGRADRIKVPRLLILGLFVLNAGEREDDCNVELLRVVAERIYLCFKLPTLRIKIQS